MFSKTYHTLSNILTNLTRLLLCLPFGMALIYTALQLTTIEPVLPLLFLTFLSVGCTLVREFVPKLSYFIALHALLGVGSALISLTSPVLFVRCVVFVFIALEIGLSLRQQLIEKRLLDNTPPLYLAPFLAGVFFARKTDAFDLLFVLILTVCILMYMLNMYILNFIKYTHIDQERFPSVFKKIAKTYHVLLFIFALAVGAAILAAHFIPLGKILSAIGAGILFILRFIVKRTKGEPAEPAPPENDLPEDVTGPLDMLPTDVETSPVWEFLDEAMHIIVPILLILLGVAVISFIIYQVYKRFYAKSMDTTDRTETIRIANTAEKLERPGISTHQLLQKLFPREPAARIRRYFTKLITSHYKTVDPTHTARELVVRPGVQGADDIAELYAKARYGNIVCNKTDADTFKKLCKKYK